MTNTKIVQVRLSRKVDEAHRREKITWVDKKQGLKVGAQIELKGDNAVWTVAEIYAGEHNFHDFEWHNNWDNNI